MGEEHVEPILIPLEWKLLYLNVQIFLNEQIFDLLPEMVGGDDHQPFNFGSIDIDFGHWGCGGVGGG